MLSDPRRRRRYDLGEDEDGMNGGGGQSGMGGMGGFGGMSPMDMEEIFAPFGGGMSRFGKRPFRGGGGRRGHTHGFPF
jgi:DnaJ family protein C protein 7